MTFVEEKEVHVESYMREGHPVRDYWRSRPGHKSGFVEEEQKHKSIMEILFPGPICFPDAQKEPEGLVMNGVDEVLTGGVEIVVGLPEMIIEALKNAGEAAGEVLSAMSPYAIKALKTAAALKARQAQAGTAYGSEMPVNYTPDGAIRGNVALDYVHETPYTPYEPIDPKELMQIMDLQGQGAHKVKLKPKIVKKSRNLQNYHNEQNNQNNFHNIDYQTLEQIQKYFYTHPNIKNSQPVRHTYDNKYAEQIDNYLKSIVGNINNSLNKIKTQTQNYAKIPARAALRYLLSDDAYKKFGPIFEKNEKLNLAMLNLMASGAYEAKFFGMKPSAELLKSALDFDKNAPKIQNSLIAKSYKELEPLSEFIKEKLISQKMDPETTSGIIHKPDSAMSEAIAKSSEMRQFIKQNSKALNNGQIVTNKSINLDSTANLESGIHLADVLLSYYDSNGDLMTVLLDTNDYNDDEKKLIVFMANTAQKKGHLKGFFNLYFVKIPRSSI